MFPVRDLDMPAGEILCEHQNEDKLHGIGGLYGKKTQVKPALRPLEYAPNQKKKEEKSRKGKKQRENRVRAPQDPNVRKRDQDGGKKRNEDPQNLPLKKVVHSHEGVHRNDPGQDKRHGSKKKDPIKMSEAFKKHKTLCRI